MAKKDAFLRDLEIEGAKTRRMLERVPDEHWTWKPHDKCSALGPLAQHIANVPSWAELTVNADGIDFAQPMERIKPITNRAELLEFHERRQAEARAAIESASDEVMEAGWTMRAGPQVFFTRPKEEVLREFVFSHIVHHRAQLGLYLRMLDIPVPGMFGPTADEA